MPVNWESLNGCSRCDALAGTYENESDLPDRPHPYCECEITVEGELTDISVYEVLWDDYEWNTSRRWWDSGVFRFSGTLTQRGRVRIVCWDGTEIERGFNFDLELEFEGQHYRDYDFDEIDWDERFFDYGEQLAHELMQSECPGSPVV
jgi:hypothetical protein